ncbi:MAG TPA: MBL fold metallo-hydrolase [Gammaproteobacteria bacterium]|nr:MBL fold metallo-hydrolase [Gammaproteobacteria bacterium]HIK69971.1 MBL fold metallo-hydrolase [Pseudomonadales bacterium]
MKKIILLILIITGSSAGLLYIVLTQSETAGLFVVKKVAQQRFQNQQSIENMLQITVCGSASPLGNNPDRAQACIAVLTADHFFIFDAGTGSQNRASQAGLPLARLDGIFLTHLHSDHISDLPEFNMSAWVGSGQSKPLTVWGPAGVDTVTRGFNQAYRIDRGFRVLHHGADFIPPEGGRLHPETVLPGIVWQDDDLTITAFEVNHAPIEPAMGYRIDYLDRSVVISGDTVTSENLFKVATGADILFHDALARPILNTMIDAAEAAGQQRVKKIITDVIDYHADATKLQQLADDAGIRMLLFYHLVPSLDNPIIEAFFERSLSGNSRIAEDLMVIELPINSDIIKIRSP